MLKIIYKGNRARKFLKLGINELADIVSTTLGAKGRNVIIETSLGVPQLTKDGVTVTSNIKLVHPVKRMGAEMVKLAAEKCASETGDGTTTVTVLARSLVNNIDSYLYKKEGNLSPIEIKRQLENLQDSCIKYIDTTSKPLDLQNDPKSLYYLSSVATISANNDHKLGEMISETYSKVGAKGAILVEESQLPFTYVDKVEGIQYDNGYVSNKFITNTVNQSCEINNPFILITNRKITRLDDIKENILLPIAEQIANKEDTGLLIIADDVEPTVLGPLIVNHLNGVAKICVVKGPSFADQRRKMLEDLGLLTGGTVSLQDDDNLLMYMTLDDLGFAEKVIVTENNFTIINPVGLHENKELITERIRIIESEKEKVRTDWERNRCDERIARLLSKMATINVGGVTELDLKETKDRVDDAIRATKSALLEGILPGGGRTYYNLYTHLTRLKLNGIANADDLVVDMLSQSFLSVLKQLYQNAQLSEKEMNDIFEQYDKTNNTYDLIQNQMVDPYDSGILDATSVVKQCIKNAIAVATAVIMTECVIVDTQSVTEMKQLNEQFGDIL